MKNYDGGMAESPFCEAHGMYPFLPLSLIARLIMGGFSAGLSYCAIGALSFLDQISPGIRKVNIFTPHTTEFESLVQWLVLRQTTTWNTEEDAEEEESHENTHDEVHQLQRDVAALSFDDRISSLPDLLPPGADLLKYAGFNGRENKVADTCYCFWVSGTLAVRNLPLGKPHWALTWNR